MTRESVETIFVDVDTQNDFLLPEGKLYVPGAEKIIPAIARLNQYAGTHGIPVISTVDAHMLDDVEFADWPPHCVVGTRGQQKPAETLLDRRVTVDGENKLPELEGAQQIILEKQKFDCFSNPNLPGVLDKLSAGRYVVYGVVTEICVQHAAMGLLDYLRDRGRSAGVELVTDAVRHLNEDARDRFFAEFQNQGGRLCGLSQALAQPE